MNTRRQFPPRYRYICTLVSVYFVLDDVAFIQRGWNLCGWGEGRGVHFYY